MQNGGRTLTVVAEALEAQLQRVRLVYVRGWHQWELYTDAQEKALIVLEASLRELCVRSLGGDTCAVSGIDSTGAALSLWDRTIAAAYSCELGHVGTNAERYSRFMSQTAEQCESLRGQPGAPVDLVKALDEWNYVTYTRPRG
jgi:hypothetical protein